MTVSKSESEMVIALFDELQVEQHLELSVQSVCNVERLPYFYT